MASSRLEWRNARKKRGVMTHCYFHPHATLERITQTVAFTQVDGDKLEQRVMLRCTCMLSDTLRCPFVCMQYDEERVDVRTCAGCGGKMEKATDDQALLTRCARCRSKMQKAYRMRAAKKSGRHVYSPVRM
jgi:hypothetical protein